MDRHRFDALAKLLATTGSRRATLAALLGVSLFGEDPDALATRGKGGNDRGKSTGKGHDQGVQGEGRPGAKHKQHHQHKHTQRHRRKQRDRQDRHDHPKPGREAGVCCGATTPCDPPAPGSSRAHCDFNEQSFADQDLHGADLRQIAGASATFDGADLHGARFTEACLRRASFRGATLADTTWDGACLFAADFTGAELGEHPEALEAAVLCATILPDGTRSDRDCDQSQAYPCCLPPPGGGGGGGQPCTGPADCPDQKCQTKACTGGTCVYTVVDDGPSPNGQCFGQCCSGNCCDSKQAVCNPLGQCCFANCSGRTCGPDGCGRGGTCGACPPGTFCRMPNGYCECNTLSCPNGCCDGATCVPTCPVNKTCKRGNCVCANSQACRPGGTCVDGRCVCTPATCPNGCCEYPPGEDNNVCLPGNSDDSCGSHGVLCAFCEEPAVCRDGICTSCPAGSCPEGQACVDGRCVCSAQSCPHGCCSNGPGNPGECRPGNRVQNCGTGGARCGTCTDQQTCLGGQCVACGPNGCTCAGQDACTSPQAPNVVCGTNFFGHPCLCVVSRAGQPFCSGDRTGIPPNGCDTDADCQKIFGSGAVCVNSDSRAGNPCGLGDPPFCARPCNF